jgi:hypothetical protein
MAVSISIVKLVDPNKERLNRNFTAIERAQTNMQDFPGAVALGTPKTEFLFRGYNRNTQISNFDIKHTSQTIKQEIRVYVPELDDIANAGQYQLKINFPMEINYSIGEMYLFCKNEYAKSCISRLTFGNFITVDTATVVNLLGVKNSPLVGNIWGIWERSEGECTRKAYFGPDVSNFVEITPDKITSVNFNYNLDGKELAICLSKENHISTLTKDVSSSELLQIYNDLREFIYP